MGVRRVARRARLRHPTSTFGLAGPGEEKRWLAWMSTLTVLTVALGGDRVCPFPVHCSHRLFNPDEAELASVTILVSGQLVSQ